METNWLAEEYARCLLEPSSVATTASDAAGACDGIKNGEWGFHTQGQNDPWWQVDLGQVRPIARVLIWNRCVAAERASRLMLKTSTDGKTWRTAYQHNGASFYGFTDKKPLQVLLTNTSARFVRIQLPGMAFLHLDEVEVFGPTEPTKNLALNRPAEQCSLSTWSRNHFVQAHPDWPARTKEVLAYCERRAKELGKPGETQEIRALTEKLNRLPASNVTESVYLQARRIQHRLALANPLLNFDTILFTKKVPPSFSHMSDQYYGWWSKPGGGIYTLRNFRSDSPEVSCLTDSFKDEGSFLRPTLSYDGTKVLFAWCKYYPKLADEANKLNKANVPEDAFYHVFEMNIDGTGVRQLTHGKYDDFDARYLPDGQIVFLSTRRGQFIQAGRQSAAQTCLKSDLPDIYVRCGGGPERPVAVYTLHTMDANGGKLTAISPFEMFEWTPEIASDGTILHSRWDYIDRDNMPYMGLWALNPDGSNLRLVYKNYTKAPHCTFEAKPIPGSHKLIFTASGHHAQTMGSLVLLDPTAGSEGSGQITRLTPEVPFPEIEAWPKTYYASPWPLSERFHLVAWGYEGATVAGPEGWNRWHAVQRPNNGMALYLFDSAGTKELLYMDPAISCSEPIPVRPRLRPPVLASSVDRSDEREGRFLLTDVYRGLKAQRGAIKSLRIVTVPPKTHPTMNYPELGITHDDPGKCVLGTVPVEADGSAYFRVPAGLIVFFQALDERGVAIQTMRSVTHVQPGQTLSCAGCHEDRQSAPHLKGVLAASRSPSKILLGPPGSWPLRFDQLVQPVLEKNCVGCHNPKGSDAQAARLDLTPPKAYQSLVSFGKPSLHDLVWAGYHRGYSVEGDGIAARSALLQRVTDLQKPCGTRLSLDELERLIVWMDTYAQRSGSFSADQEKSLHALREASSHMLTPRKATPAGSTSGLR